MKLLPAALASLLVVSNGFWVYRTIDQSITEGYRAQERYEAANRLVAATTVANDSLRGRSKPEVEELLHRLFPKDTIFEKEGAIHTTWLTLPLSHEGRVERVELDRRTVEEANSVIVGNELFYGSRVASGPKP